MSWSKFTGILGIVILAASVVAYVLGAVDIVAVVLSTLGLISIWIARLEKTLGESEFLYSKISVTWDKNLWTFKIGNNVSQLTREELSDFIKKLGYTSDVGSEDE